MPAGGDPADKPVTRGVPVVKLDKSEAAKEVVLLAEREKLVRFGVAFPERLIEQFDRYIGELGYTNRSEAIRDMARRALLEPSRIEPGALVAGTLVMVYDHHVRELPLLLTELQHEYHRHIISTTHVHLNRDECLEVIVVRGRMEALRELHRLIQSQKGVHYAELSVTFADGRHGGEDGGGMDTEDEQGRHTHAHGHGHEHDHGRSRNFGHADIVPENG